MTWHAWLVLALIGPSFLASAIGTLAGRRLGRTQGWLATGLSALGTLASIGLIAARWSDSVVIASLDGLSDPWRQTVLGLDLPGPTSTFTITFGFAVDRWAALFLGFVSVLATLTHVYALGFLRDEPDQPRFFTYLPLFVGSMLLLVVSPNLLQLYACWELIGLGSYVLISFWRTNPSAVQAGTKAFVVNRIGDAGLLIALGLFVGYAGTLDLNALAAGATESMPTWALMLACAGITLGCFGKSAQTPLHVWLPDAMAGPTPVSALIHAATLVAAGVYLLGRTLVFFPEPIGLIIAYNGAFTFLFAALVAGVQRDIKRTLAYSTISQLGTMMIALGCGAWSTAVVHLLTHGFLKALLFLGAGSVANGAGTYDLSRLGGLRKRMPWTAWTMGLAALSLAGLPPLAGFFSKDAILAIALETADRNPEHIGLFLLPLIGTALTGFYLSRLWLLCFSGAPRSEGAAEAEESSALLVVPLVILVVPSVLVAWPVFGLEPLLSSIGPSGLEMTSMFRWDVVAGAVMTVSLGIVVASTLYLPIRRIDPARLARRFGVLSRLLTDRHLVDLLYRTLLVRPTLHLAKGLARFDRRVLDLVPRALAVNATRIGRFAGIVDRRGVDQPTRTIPFGLGQLGRFGSRLQTGRIRDYVLGFSIAMTVLLLTTWIWTR